jgi:hypothetical protein
MVSMCTQDSDSAYFNLSDVNWITRTTKPPLTIVNFISMLDHWFPYWIESVINSKYNIGRFVMQRGRKPEPQGEKYVVRQLRVWDWPGIEHTTSEVTGAVDFTMHRTWPAPPTDVTQLGTKPARSVVSLTFIFQTGSFTVDNYVILT